MTYFKIFEPFTDLKWLKNCEILNLSIFIKVLSGKNIKPINLWGCKRPISIYNKNPNNFIIFPQGLCVALLFCFFNGEVIAQVKRKWRVVFFRPRANSYTATQVSVRNSIMSLVYNEFFLFFLHNC